MGDVGWVREGRSAYRGFPPSIHGLGEGRGYFGSSRLCLSDWAKAGEPGGPVGQQMMVNFVEVQPVLDPSAGR